MDERKESGKKRTHKKKKHWKLWTKHLPATGTCELAQLLLASHWRTESVACQWLLVLACMQASHAGPPSSHKMLQCFQRTHPILILEGIIYQKKNIKEKKISDRLVVVLFSRIFPARRIPRALQRQRSRTRWSYCWLRLLHMVWGWYWIVLRRCSRRN